MTNFQDTGTKISLLKRFGNAVNRFTDEVVGKLESGLSGVESALDPIAVSALKERPLSKLDRVLEQAFFNTRNDYVDIDPSGKPILKEEPRLRDLASSVGREKWGRFINES